MAQKYKLRRQHGFNPFRNKIIQSLKLEMKRNNLQIMRELVCGQFGIVLDNDKNVGSQTDKMGALVSQNVQIHQQRSQLSQTKKLIMFNQKQYCHKEFTQIFYQKYMRHNFSLFTKQLFSSPISQTQNTTTVHQQQQQKHQQQQQSSKLIMYLSNSGQFSQQMITGYNKILHQSTYHNNKNVNEMSQQNSNPSNILNELYKQMLITKDKQQRHASQIYFSSIGVKKQNQLYDLLNQQYLDSQQYSNNNNINNKNIPSVKVKKLSAQIDSVNAQNLTKQIIINPKHFSQLIKKTLLIKNQIQSFHNFNQSFLIGQLYHFYQANSNYDIFNEIILFKINQTLLTNITYEDGFYQRRMKEDHISSVSSLLMRIGMNIKYSRKNNKIEKVLIQKQNSTNFSQIQMHSSKILLYLSPIFFNPQTSYILVNQIDPNLTLNSIVRKFQLNKNFIKKGNSRKSFLQKQFFYLKHYLDNYDVLKVVQKLAIKFVPNKNYIGYVNNKNRPLSMVNQHYCEKRNVSSTKNNNYQKSYTQLIRNKPILSILSQQQKSNSARHFNNNSKMNVKKYNDRIKSKSFFSQTITSAERNYLKSKQRQNRNNTKSFQQKQKQKQHLQQKYNSKTINQRVENFKFVQGNYLTLYKPHGIRISYKRKMVVKRFQLLDDKIINYDVI